MSYDKIETIDTSLIQHGHNNKRVYIMSMRTEDIGAFLEKIYSLANNNNYTKIFAKINSRFEKQFINDGFQREAFIKGYYNGKEDALFVSKFLSKQRSIATNYSEIDNIIKVAQAKKTAQSRLKSNYQIILCNPNQATEIAQVYKIVFPTYPFPIHEASYIVNTMNSHIKYFAVIDENKRIIALSSSEMDKASQSVEMTDFATLPEYLGQGLALELLKAMEIEMEKDNILTAYTIARADSFGMNITFAKNSYSYSGTLVNNTYIFGNIESMNVWSKKI
jgi:beta-lysine N6-acetyltransferase